MIHGYDKAVATMEVGQTINIHLMPEEAYGMPDPRAISRWRSHSFRDLRTLKWDSRSI